MEIGVPKEIKAHEYRVGLVPESVGDLVEAGHQVYVETGAGLGIQCTDRDFENFGAKIVNHVDQLFEKSELIVKVKEPQPIECQRLKAHHLLFTYLHLASDRPQADGLIKSGCSAIAYETITDHAGRLPLLEPMSEVAGRISIQAGATALQSHCKGRGVLLGGVPGVAPGYVVIIGGGTVGFQAASVAVGMGAQVVVMDIQLAKLREFQKVFGARVMTCYASHAMIAEQLAMADLVIGAVLVPGGASPKLVTRSMLKGMKPGSVFVDVAIDQGGCAETSRPTTHDDPTFIEESVVHYCVANMPGAVPRTSAYALNNATLPYTLQLANGGYDQWIQDVHRRNGVNIHAGQVTHQVVAQDLGLPYQPIHIS
jgi:alanine dehydrogenase